MRPAQQVMADLAAAGLNADQLALVMELSAAVATEARPVEDTAAKRRRARDREYQAERRQNRQKSPDVPLKDNSKPHSVSDETGGEPPDPAKIMFDLGISMLTGQGKTEREARSIVGSWRKGGRQDGDIAGALVEAKQRAITNLVEWMPKRLNGAGSRDFADIVLAEHRNRQTVGASP